MRIDERRSINSNADASEIAETTLEGRGITLRFDDITAVSEELTVVRSGVYNGDRARIFTADASVVVRNTKAAVVASITALGGFVETLVLTTYQGREIEIRSASIFAVEEGLPDIRDPVYTGDRSTVSFGQAHQVVVRSTAAAVLALITGTAQRFSNYVHLRDEKPDGTAGGTFVSGAWRTRDINTEANDDDGLASILANQITLAAGTYYTRIKTPSLRVQSNISRLYDFTNGAVLLLGTNEYSEATPFGSHSSSVINGIFSLAAATVLEIQHHCFLTRTLHGFGGSVFTSAPQPVEVYTVAEFWRIGL